MASNGHESGGVDQMLPPAKLATLGLQHVLVMYAGAVAVPLIIAGALGLPAEQRAILISADILACGLASLVQSLGLPYVGIRMPVMMGVTFASVAPMLALIAAAKDVGGAGFVPTSPLLIVYGAVISAGVFAIVVGAAHELPDPPVSRRRHRLDHSHHRRVADADRRRLGRRTACGSEYRRRRLQGHDSKSKPGRARRIRPVAGRAPRHSRRQQIRQGIRRQHLGVDRPRRRRRGGRGDGQDEFRGGRLGAGRRNRVAVPVWHAPVLARADRDHVHRDGRRDDRVRPACSWRSAR